MMEIDNTMDQYEKQLYTLFASYDAAHNGSLSREALEELCNTLQLENRGHQLIELLLNGSEELCVTFPKFRDGLLTVLGSEHSETSVKILDRSDLNSGEESSGREVSPRFIFGSKKYGRRSKPSRSSDSNDSVPGTIHEADDSSIEAFDSEVSYPSLTSQDKNVGSKKRKANNKLKKSLSFSGHKNSDNTDNKSDSVLSKAKKQLTLSKTEYLDCISINASLPHEITIRESNNSENSLNILDCNSNSQIDISQPVCFEDIIKNTGLASCLQSMANNELLSLQSQREHEESVSLVTIMELWGAAGISQPHQLLSHLGFTQGEAVLSDLIFVMEEEIQGVINNLQESYSASSLITLFQAVLCLYQYEKKSLKLSLNHTYAERDKLRSDLSDANHRAVLLAHEVDDNHAKMESAAKITFKQIEQKHSEIIKQLSEQLILDKEQFASSVSNLETKISTLESEESKLKSQMSELNYENTRLDKELNSAQEQIYELVEIKKQLSKEIKSISKEINTNIQDSMEKVNEVALLESQISKLQNENIVLKDKNDELCAEIEIIKLSQPTDKLKFNRGTVTEDSFSADLDDDSTTQSGTLITIAYCGVNGTSHGNYPQQVSDEESPIKSKIKLEHKNLLTPSEKNIIKSDGSENNSFDFSFEYDNNQTHDMLICIKHLTPENVEELITIFKVCV